MSVETQEVPDQSGIEDTHSVEEAGPPPATHEVGEPVDLPGAAELSPTPVEQSDGVSPKFSMKKFSLQAMLVKAGAVIPSRDVLAVLKNFYFELSEGKIRVAATDLELAIVVTGEMVSVSRTGSAVFPARKMLEIVSEAAEGDLLVDVEGNIATITVGRATWTIMLADGSEYPALPEDEDIERVPVKRSDFLTALLSVRSAAARDSTKQSLMMIDITDGKVRAADGVRFQQVEVLGIPDIQIPINAVDDLVKILRSTEAAEVEVGQDETSLVFRIGADEFVAQKPTATFPDVNSLLLKPALLNDQELHIDRDELIAAIKRVRINADTDTSAVMLELKANEVTVRAKDKTGSRASEPVSAVWKSPDRALVFNYTHLLDLLQSLEAKTAVLKVGPDTKTRPTPLLTQEESAGRIAVLTQLRMDWVN